MSFHFGSALAFVAVACVFLSVTLLVGRLVRPKVPTREKSTVYECGEVPLGGGWFNFNPRFYVVALVFLIFDVEVVFTYPVAVVFRRWLARGEALTAFVEIAAFIGVLGFGLAYVWVKGDLEWLRGLAKSDPGDAADKADTASKAAQDEGERHLPSPAPSA